MAIAKKWKEIGAHMVNMHNTLTSRDSLLIDSNLWHEYFSLFYNKFFDYVHCLGMYTGYGIDGNVLAIVPGLKEAGLDIPEYQEPLAIGMGTLAKVSGRKTCCKCSIDMQKIRVEGTPGAIWRQVEKLVNTLGSRNGDS